MNSDSIYNSFKGVSSPSLSEEQKREIAKLLANYLNSREFALHVKAILEKC